MRLVGKANIIMQSTAASCRGRAEPTIDNYLKYRY